MPTKETVADGGIRGFWWFGLDLGRLRWGEGGIGVSE
jgi:hypothetical protein